MKYTRKATKMLIAGAVAVATVIGMSGTASANSDPWALHQGETLNVGDSIITPIGDFNRYELIMQADGNLVEYLWSGDPSAGQQSRTPIWATGTNGTGADHATYQQDGNFVVYAGSWAPWASNTVHGGGSTVDISTQGSLYVGYTRVFCRC
ncbi:hypothetical protein GCM10009665_54640 [Kitasatospora nipponensis]|uniref:Bulb-type lectin domain-containing protein n=1 Tax=Kitasatospora nipponensis TaxID=258049 RepID=A0ABN1WR08_9ACTN